MVSCGSNIEPTTNLSTALELLASRWAIKSVSRVWITRAVAERAMPDFHNAAVEVLVSCTPAELKYGTLREIEWLQGRRRSSNRNAPRPIDLDLSLYADRVVDSEPLGLVIPDPEILTRAHLALPLADVAPDRLHPQSGETLAVIAARLRAATPAGNLRLAEDCERLRSAVGGGPRGG